MSTSRIQRITILKCNWAGHVDTRILNWIFRTDKRNRPPTQSRNDIERIKRHCIRILNRQMFNSGLKNRLKDYNDNDKL